MSIDRVSKQAANYDSEVIKIKDNQGNEQQVNLSVFVEGMAIAADTQKALSIFDKNKDGKISNDEANDLKEAIFKNAGKDKTLDDKEILKILKLKKNSDAAAAFLKQFKTMVERQFKGNLSTTIQANDGREIKSNFNADGSGTTVTTEQNGRVTTCTYDAGKILRKKEVVDSEKRKTVVNYDYDGGDKPTEITVESFNKIGRLKEKQTVINKYNKETGKLESSETTIKTAGKKERKLTTTYTYDAETGKLTDETTEEKKKSTNIHYDYDENGKVEKKTTTKKPDGITITAEFKDGKIQKQTTTEHKIKFKLDNGKFVPSFDNSSSVIEYSYHENGNKSEITIHGEDSYGKTSDTKYEYDESGKMISATKSYFKRGVYVEEKYEGTNLENRTSGGVASEIIEYEDADKTKIKQKTVNIFDSDGILIGDEIYDGDGKKIGEHDFSKLDGKFETAYQKGRGDCYLLAAINSLASSEAGNELLKDKISQVGDNFVVKFPGAKIARENLIKEMKAKDPNFDVSKIDIPDEYTITAADLKEAMLKSGTKYSIGDKDVLLMEIAYEKYREAVAVTLNENNIQPKDYMQLLSLNLDGDDYLESGLCSEAIFILTGKTSEVYITKDFNNTPVCYVDSEFQMHVANPSGEMQKAATSITTQTNKQKLIDKLKKATVEGTIQNYAATAAFRVSSQEINGKVINRNQRNGHAFTIKSVTDTQVVLANPWNPEKDVVMSMDDFLKAAYMIEISDLAANSDSSSEPADNTGNSAPQPPNPSQTPPVQDNGTPYTVPKGKGFTTLIKEKLIEQGIQPTKQNIMKAKAQFKAANPGAVKVYNGVKKEWKGNEYLLQDAQVLIPKFKKDEDGNVT